MEEETDVVKKRQLAHKIQVWKEAITEFSLLRGMTASVRRETLLIDQIVREVTMELDQLKEIELLHLSWWESLIIRPITNFCKYAGLHPFIVGITVVKGVVGVLYLAYGSKLWLFGTLIPCPMLRWDFKSCFDRS